MSVSCPLAELAERAALGIELTHEESSRLEGHDIEGCSECRALTENAREVEGLLTDAFDKVGDVLDRREEPSIERIQREIAKLELAPPRKLRRLNWRFILFATNLCAFLLLALNFTTLLAIVKMRRVSASETARTEARTLAIALATYRREHDGALPTDLRGVVDALAGSRPGTDEVYFKFNPGRRTLIGYKDPWFRLYRYELDADASTGFRIWSVGRNGTDENGAGDDVFVQKLLPPVMPPEEPPEEPGEEPGDDDGAGDDGDDGAGGG